MEKRILGVILSVLGIVGLVMAGMKFLHGGGGNYNVKEIALYGILGALFFFSGISLIKNTKDKPT